MCPRKDLLDAADPGATQLGEGAVGLLIHQ